MKPYPMMMNIEDKKCIIIGGGEVACRKAMHLLKCGAKVKIISPVIHSKLDEAVQNNKIQWMNRGYTFGDLKGAFLVYIATNQSKVNTMCLEEAKKENILTNIVDDTKACDFVVPSCIRQGDLTITVSTNGKSPMLSKKIRKELQQQFGQEYKVFIECLGIIRKEVLAEVENIHLRKEIFRKIVYSSILKDFIEGKIVDLKNAMEKIAQDTLDDSIK